MLLVYSSLVFYAGLFLGVEGHGRLMDPPSRSSMWRLGFKTPVNYDDIELYCGGMAHQWTFNHGKCGICGDPHEGPRANEAGGKYATGIISRYYHKDQIITVDVDLTTNHLGWFEFRLCPNNNVKKPATHECLNKYLLRLANGNGTRLYIGQKKGHIFTKLKLPAGLTCSQCVFQWKYHTGNTWGEGNKCVGMGCSDAQEEFYGCADIAILNKGAPIPSTIRPRTRRPHVSTSRSGHMKHSTSHRRPSTQSPRRSTSVPQKFKNCHAIGAWAGIYDNWCKDFCPKGSCPKNMCRCA
ncbi:uncharacterized protein LOC115215838 [Octopus sinensis]|uniref:Uncharacterized protein LOC115215838 n=1 Tax=Octopus sinensis TaxID=2607531 RepID=A0A6P7SS96_9MOLL|nr:uncharacterized protein LOC115215838 [Octopus sinensis]